MPEGSVSRSLSKWFKQRRLSRKGKNIVLEVTCERSKELNACQHTDRSVFRDGDRRPDREKESRREASAARWWQPQDLQCFSRWHELSSQNKRTVKIAFDKENGYIIV